ncbi:hypothetical protein ABLI39_02270 [Pseudarthrobacter sp. B907]|uniref:hypothetical protein n=1 Tax=Pseudarthrobacter sp. B907 TaxID=3158261 RepID=UPI0032DB5956
MNQTEHTAASGVPRPKAWSLQATEILWGDVRAEFGLLTATELSLRIGPGIEDPVLVHGLYREGQLIAMHRAGQMLFPGFQVQRGTGAVYTVIRDLRQTAGSAGADQSMIKWLITPSVNLDQARPVDLLDHSELVLAAARKSFGRR